MLSEFTPLGQVLLARLSNSNICIYDDSSSELRSTLNLSGDAATKPIPDGLYAFIQDHKGQFAIQTVRQYETAHGCLCRRAFKGDTPIINAGVFPILEFTTQKTDSQTETVRAGGELVIISGEPIIWTLKSGSFSRKESDKDLVGLPVKNYIPIAVFDFLIETGVYRKLFTETGDIQLSMRKKEYIEMLMDEISITLQESTNNQIVYHAMSFILNLYMKTQLRSNAAVSAESASASASAPKRLTQPVLAQPKGGYSSAPHSPRLVRFLAKQPKVAFFKRCGSEHDLQTLPDNERTRSPFVL